MSQRYIFRAAIGLIFLLSLNSTQAAWVASVDQLQIDRNGSTVWNDDFSADTSALYNNNLPVTVSGGRAQMNSRDGAYGISGISGRPRWFGRMRNSTWLYETDSFFVSSVFDIVTADAEGRYGMRLSDASPTSALDDMLDLGLYFNPAGEAQIRYRYNNDVRDPALADGFDFVQSTGLLDLTAYSQVSFFFKNDGDGIIDAGFLLLETPGSLDLATMSSSINWFDTGYYAFNGENRLRTELVNVEMDNPADVPEPSAALILATGLFSLMVFHRRRLTT